MTLNQVLLKFYLHPCQAMDALAEEKTPRFGAIYVLSRGLMLSLLFYLPLYLLKFKPVSPAYLKIFDTPDYFLYAIFIWPLYGILSWVYLMGIQYLLLRLMKYKVDFDRLLNLDGLLNLGIGIVILIFDWLMIAIKLHENFVFSGIAHLVIADPWTITLSAIFYKKYFKVPVWLTVVSGILLRILYFPIAMVFIRT